MNQKGISTLVIAVIVVVVIAVVGVGVYLYMSGSGGNGGEPTPTPTPTAPDVEGASNLQFSVEVTSEGTGRRILGQLT
jgi:flagellar basal body-associated protein FliL